MTKKITLLITIIIFCLNFSLAQAAPNNLSKKSSLVINLNNGKIIHADKHHEHRYPASLVKMMTLYVTFYKLKRGELSLDQDLPISKKAASMPRTNLSLKAGNKISVRKAILGLIVHSSNDTAVVLAEAIAGSELNFAKLMNAQAKKLGMTKTTYCNASGWHHKDQKSTAYDLAKLSIALKRDFPEFFPWFSIKSFSFNGKTYKSHNHVACNYQWATGLKTGFTNPSGFNLATTADKHGNELVAIVLGENTAKSRDNYMIKLLDNSFHKITYPATMRMANIAKKNKSYNNKKPK